jgi:predicted SAM-dependent methyltransferase
VNRRARRAQRPKLALVEAKSTPSLKLDLGCGQNPKEGFEGVDVRGGKAKHEVDLFKFPWPFENDSVEEIHASHFLEHVPAREVEERDLRQTTVTVKDLTDPMSIQDAVRRRQEGKAVYGEGVVARFLGVDMLFAFMDECYRILKPECWMHVIVPSGRSNRAFWDPTHRRFFMQETFLYFARDWRQQQGLDHYRVACNFGVEVTHSMPQEEGLKSADAQSARFQTLWNVTVDWHAKLKKLP